MERVCAAHGLAYRAVYRSVYTQLGQLRKAGVLPAAARLAVAHDAMLRAWVGRSKKVKGSDLNGRSGVRHGNRPSDSFALPTSIVRDFAALSDHAFDRVLQEVRRADDLRLPKEAQASLRADLGDEARVALMILSFTRSIFNNLHQAEDFDEAKRDLLDVMRVVLADDLGGSEDRDKILSRVDALLQPWEGTVTRRKQEWLETGILQTAVEFASFVDLRPDFSDDRSNIVSLVPVIIMEVATRSDSAGRDAFQFQMSVRQFDEMKKFMKDVEQKLETLSARYPLRSSDA